MRFANILILLFFVTFTCCQSKPDPKVKKYELIADDDGILVEKFDSTIVDENKYNHNNAIYKSGSGFKYKFNHITPKGEIKFFKIKESGNDWEFIDEDSTDSTTIKSVAIEVANGNPMAKYIPGYNQTVLKYKNEKLKHYSMSGAIENEANVWIHPPRDNYFKILELNPFPYIKMPYEIGTNWTWNLKIGDSWADDRWRLWEGQIENQYEYEITGKQILKTNLGDLECLIIDSKATSRIGETGLVAFFNPKYGFVKLDYTNIDGSKTKLELIEHKEKKNNR